MARKRIIDPEFWDDPELGAEHSDLRLLYEGIWTQADDEGRLLYDIKRLHRLVFGYRKSVSIKRTEMLISRLIDPLKKLVPYSVNGKDYLFAKNFLIYQKLSHPTPSKLPPPPENSGELQKTPESSGGFLPKSSQSNLIKKKSVQSDHIDHNILCKELSTDRLTDSFKKQICKTKTFKAFCELMEVRGWCMDRDLCTGIIKEIWAKVQKKKPKNLMGYMNRSLKNYVLEHADEISEKVKKLRGNK